MGSDTKPHQAKPGEKAKVGKDLYQRGCKHFRSKSAKEYLKHSWIFFFFRPKRLSHLTLKWTKCSVPAEFSHPPALLPPAMYAQ